MSGLLDVNGAVYWVNRSLHGYKGHGHVYITEFVYEMCVEQRQGVSALHRPKGEICERLSAGKGQ